MALDQKTTNKLIKLFEGYDYRKVVSARCKVHPNTVTNVLNGNDNITVELELLIYAQEVQALKEKDNEKRKRARAIIKQL